jgi:hypothetical protein
MLRRDELPHNAVPGMTVCIVAMYGPVVEKVSHRVVAIERAPRLACESYCPPPP